MVFLIICISLGADHVEHLFVLFLENQYIFFGEMSAQILCPILYRLPV